MKLRYIKEYNESRYYKEISENEYRSSVFNAPYEGVSITGLLKKEIVPLDNRELSSIEKFGKGIKYYTILNETNRKFSFKTTIYVPLVSSTIKT